jgi:ADP-heptose:LPS heptosyltransferase
MELLKRLSQELNLDVILRDGRPRLDLTSVSGPRWPRKLVPEICVAIDPYELQSHRSWPLPRFEILIANLDSIGLKAVAVGIPGEAHQTEKLLRVATDFSNRKRAIHQAHVISKCMLWVGHDTLWRHVAAAVGTPQIVIALEGSVSEPCYEDTVVVFPGKAKAESKALGPLGVTEVAEAITNWLKSGANQRRHSEL